MIRRCQVKEGRTHWYWVATPEDWFLWINVGAVLASIIGLFFV